MKERLKELRKTLGLKQREVAERLGVSIGSLGAWETGKESVPRARIYQLCKEFNVRREWLETGEGEMFEPGLTEEDKYVQMFINLYDKLPEEFKEIFRRVANEKLGVNVRSEEEAESAQGNVKTATVSNVRGDVNIRQ